jgi:hypothetical protein
MDGPDEGCSLDLCDKMITGSFGVVSIKPKNKKKTYKNNIDFSN